jgi:hypothetical protein
LFRCQIKGGRFHTLIISRRQARCNLPSPAGGAARENVRGVRNKQSNAGTRLADALYGLIRDADEGEPWAMTILAQLRPHRVVTLV